MYLNPIFKGCPGWGANTGSFDFVLFSHSITLPLSHSGSPTNTFFVNQWFSQPQKVAKKFGQLV
jgi:hypothetical protein